MRIKRKAMEVDGVEIKDAMFDILAEAKIGGIIFSVYASAVQARKDGGIIFKDVVIDASGTVDEQEADQIGEDLLVGETVRMIEEDNRR